MGWFDRMFRRDAAEPLQLAVLPPPDSVALVPAPSAPVDRADGYTNVITGLGTARDKRLGGSLQVDFVTDDEARELWLGDWLAKRIIELLPRIALRRGFTIKIDQDVEQAEAIDKAARDRKLKAKFLEAIMKRRAYGGAALMPVMTGSLGDISTPFTDDMLPRISSLKAFHILEPRELTPVEWYSNLSDEKFGEPSRYLFVPIQTGAGSTRIQTIHESRLIIFQGVKVTRLIQNGTRYGWGDNVLTPVREKISDYGQGWGAVSSLLADFAQAVLKLKGLSNLVGTDQDKVARDRLIQIDLIRSFMRAVVIDQEDDFDRKQTPVTGLAELLNEMAMTVAAAAGYPMTALFGTSPKGMNATGESDLTMLYDNAETEQEDVTPQLERAHTLIMAAQDGPTGGKIPKNWSTAWHPMRSPSAKEDAETKWLIAQADDKNVNNQIYTAVEAADSHYGGDTFRPDIVLDKAARAAMLKLDPHGNPAAPPAGPPPAATVVDPNAPPPDEMRTVAPSAGVRRSAVKMPPAPGEG